MSAGPNLPAIQAALSIATSVVDRLQAEGVDTDEEELMEVLRSKDLPVDALLDRVLRAAVDADMDCKKIGGRIAELAERRQRFAHRREAWRSAAMAILDALPSVFPNGKHKSAEFTASLRVGGPKVLVQEPALLPDELCRIERTPDMTKVKEALEAGPVPGAEMSNGAPQLMIRKN